MKVEAKSVRIIRTVVETLRPQFNIELWDGTRIGNFDGPSLVINDPSIVRQLMLKPNYDSLIDIWTSGRVDIHNGTLFDLANAKLDGSLKKRLKELPKWQLLKDLPALMFAGRPTSAIAPGCFRRRMWCAARRSTRPRCCARKTRSAISSPARGRISFSSTAIPPRTRPCCPSPTIS